MANPKKKTTKKREKVEANGVAHIRVTFNNTNITLTDM
ncbi:MAG TPA: 30S ribosomal protein S11, partial [bacterium]|nr:30S ribosomal protein S11 [bacterium]